MTKTDKEWSITPVVEWVLTEGRFLPDDVLVGEMGRRLAAEGAPVWRLFMSFQLLHPLFVARAAVWTRDDDQLRRFSVLDEIRQSDAYVGSPIQHLYEKREPLRQRLDAHARDIHATYADMIDQGYTDYFGQPVRFTGKSGSVMIVVSKQPGGFGDADIDKLRRFSELIASVAETIATRSLTRSLLDTYVGHRTGEKVLNGMIKRGDAEFIDAALWFSDLRNFTHLTETLPPKQILAMLNSYFEFVAAAVTARGGEILRFIGDAMLIVFPVPDDTPPNDACRAALDSAQDALASLATINHRRRRAGDPEINFGVGLNVGEVIYGNVGAPDRLDFTVMGPAVNRAARLESLTKELDEPILMSRAFTDALIEKARPCGTHAMKGIAERQEVFAPAELT